MAKVEEKKEGIQLKKKKKSSQCKGQWVPMLSKEYTAFLDCRLHLVLFCVRPVSDNNSSWSVLICNTVDVAVLVKWKRSPVLVCV